MAHRVLIADDTEVMRAMIRLALESVGFEIVAEATNGDDAVALYLQHRPDCITLDINMGMTDGLQAARTLLEHDPGLRFVVCTTQGQEEQIREAVEMGAADFVVKPFTPERIIQAVRTAVGS